MSKPNSEHMKAMKDHHLKALGRSYYQLLGSNKNNVVTTQAASSAATSAQHLTDISPGSASTGGTGTANTSAPAGA